MEFKSYGNQTYMLTIDRFTLYSHQIYIKFIKDMTINVKCNSLQNGLLHRKETIPVELTSIINPCLMKGGRQCPN